MVDRERIIRSGREVSYTCEYLGLPTPALSWYYNGVAIRSRGGLIVDGNELNITDPEISHSGVYQCIVENMFDGIRYTDMRAWILEVRDPRKSYSSMPWNVSSCVYMYTVMHVQ